MNKGYHSIQSSADSTGGVKGSGGLKHRIRLWAALRWTALIGAIVFAIGYVGILMLWPGLNMLEVAYPDRLPQIGFYFHAFPGSAWVVFGCLQFFAFIRSRSPTLHRVFGYIALSSVPISTAGGSVIIASGKTEGGQSLQVFGVLFFIIWITCCVCGWYYMHYQRNVKKHREWMIRAYILSYTIILMRPGISVYLMFAPDSTPNGEALAIVAPLMWILALLFLEVYIRRERSDQVNIEQHYVSIPSKASEEDGLIRIVNYQRNFVQVKLVQKQELNHNTSLFVFELPEKAELFTFPGHHVTLRHKESGVVCRHYSPITEFTRHFGRQGAMALAIKRYQEGLMSEWLHDKLEVGETVEMMGPSGTFYYAPSQYEAIGLIAGGTGITPFLSLVVSVLTNRADQTQIKLLYIASSARDFIFKQELEQLVQQFPNSFEVSFVADRGHIRNRSDLSEFLPKPSDSSLIALCGPIGFCTTVQKSLSQLKYKEHMVYTFGETD